MKFDYDDIKTYYKILNDSIKKSDDLIELIVNILITIKTISQQKKVNNNAELE